MITKISPIFPHSLHWNPLHPTEQRTFFHPSLPKSKYLRSQQPFFPPSAPKWMTLFLFFPFPLTRSASPQLASFQSDKNLENSDKWMQLFPFSCFSRVSNKKQHCSSSGLYFNIKWARCIICVLKSPNTHQHFCHMWQPSSEI